MRFGNIKLYLSQCLSNLLSLPQIGNGNIVPIGKERIFNSVTRIVSSLNCAMKYCYLATYFALVESV